MSIVLNLIYRVYNSSVIFWGTLCRVTRPHMTVFYVNGWCKRIQKQYQQNVLKAIGISFLFELVLSCINLTDTKSTFYCVLQQAYVCAPFVFSICIFLFIHSTCTRIPSSIYSSFLSIPVSQRLTPPRPPSARSNPE